ncbi:PiggyBac transposable element-derived protein 4-like 8 [Homarus americanus]|uniref:PiggyBac transposable element-derived protein 4-like 8 n=1 Tax=Homarus americanus TaxID=6706 RepID=A0A8J5K227_HOMAM|nr:PiggyBac transposable element-derived protein 4-like 8 [Homarus americanus]
MIQKIVAHTYVLISALSTKFSKKMATIEETSIGETKTLIGILILSGCRRDNHLSSAEMWHQLAGTPLYQAAMSERRFCFLLRCLHFDDAATRSKRKKTDRLASIRNFWDEFVSKCHIHYIPEDALTIDEQLLAFHGRCLFWMYIPNKPAKYGIKLVMMCDVDTKYMLNAIPYLGKQSTTLQASKGLHQGHYFTKELTKPYFSSGRNITTDN